MFGSIMTRQEVSELIPTSQDQKSRPEVRTQSSALIEQQHNDEVSKPKSLDQYIYRYTTLFACRQHTQHTINKQ